MAITPNTRLSCTHIKVNGVPCGSPALRGQIFCYFHQRMIRGVKTPPKSRLHPIALLEDPAAIQSSLMEVVNALVRNTIDPRRAQLILRALHIAVKNSPRVHFNLLKDEMVTQIPEYPAAPEQPKPVPAKSARPKPVDAALAQASVLAAIKQPKPVPTTPTEVVAAATKVDPTRRKPPLGVKLPASVKPQVAVHTFPHGRSG